MHTPGTVELTQEPTAWHLRLHGEHDLATAPELEQAMRTVLDSGTTVLIDLTGATFIDSTVIHWLLRWAGHAGQPDTTLRLAVVGASPESAAGRVIDLAGLRHSIPLYPTTNEALTAVASDRSEG
ncbi:MAG TPA: STAS domain-containing protein [Gaiellales bacterium]|nr:STAS domain-containing protein [Gaiellales bacterium]